MASHQYVDKAQARQSYRNVWHIDLMNTITADTPYCCFAMWCPPCASYLLRKRALYNEMSRYTCCAGYMPCSGKCGERNCPEFCLCTEVILCFCNSVASTRFLLQDEFNIQTTKWVYVLPPTIGMYIFSIVAMIFGSDEITEASQLLNCLADMSYCTVCACMQTQHKIEMDKRDGKLAPQVPPIQQTMSRIDQGSVPLPVFYTQQQPAYGQPAYGYPPPSQTPSYPQR